MKIAIHHRKEGFSQYWIDYCRKHQIEYKIVDCCSNTIVEEMSDCDALMWHFHQASCKDVLFAKQLIYSLQTAGKVVFPDFHTAWHFDDKVGQKYLLEAVGAPLVPSYVFYDKEEALQWAESADFPKVFKLRTGSGSSHVKLIGDQNSAKKIIKRAFGEGFSQYEAGSNLKERWRKYKNGMVDFLDVIKGLVRFGYTTDYDRIAGNEKGYVYFQDFIPDNDYDIRVIVIDGKACAIKRLNREGDFRASGSGKLVYEKDQFDEHLIEKSFKVAEKIKSKSLAIDYVFSKDSPLFVELSYGFPAGPFVENCHGYWDRQLKWYPGPFNAQGWMVGSVIKRIDSNKAMAVVNGKNT